MIVIEMVIGDSRIHLIGAICGIENYGVCYLEMTFLCYIN